MNLYFNNNNLLADEHKENKYAYFLGDYNVNTLNELLCKSSLTQDFINLMASYSYNNLICMPTRVINGSSSLLDNIYTNLPNVYETRQIGVLYCIRSTDHMPIFTVRNVVYTNLIEGDAFRNRRNFGNQRKSERIWRKTKLTVHLEIFRALCLKLKTLIYDAKEKCYKKQISDCGGDQKQLFGIVNSILGRGRQIVYPQHMDSFTLASLFNNYFITKIADIRNEFPALESNAAQLSVTDFNAHSNVSHTSLTDFTPTNIEEVQKLLSKMNKTTCKLDPFCTSISMQYPQFDSCLCIYH